MIFTGCISICYRVGLALLKTAEDELLALPFEQLLAALNSKRFPAFSKSPGQLMKVAMSIKVSRRLATSGGEYQQPKGMQLHGQVSFLRALHPLPSIYYGVDVIYAVPSLLKSNEITCSDFHSMSRVGCRQLFV